MLRAAELGDLAGAAGLLEGVRILMLTLIRLMIVRMLILTQLLGTGSIVMIGRRRGRARPARLQRRDQRLRAGGRRGERHPVVVVYSNVVYYCIAYYNNNKKKKKKKNMIMIT